MSTDGGIGVGAVPEVASVLLSLDLEKTESDVPVALRHGSKQLPLGAYLRRKLRAHLGKDTKCPPEVLAALEEGLSPLRTLAFDASRSLSGAYKELHAGEIARVETRYEIFKRKDKL